jgi:hypothetical protein
MRTVAQTLRASVTPHRQQSATSAWTLWTRFCTASGIRPDLRDLPGDPVPVLQLFALRYRTGRIAPSGRPVRARTVEDALRHVAQALAGMGAPDPRLNRFGDLDYRLQALLQAWRRQDPPPLRVKPLPPSIIRLALTGLLHPCAASMATADCLVVAFYFLLRPGEYAGTPSLSSDDLFRVGDVGLWIGHRRLDPLTSPPADLLASTFVTLTFTNQKNGVRGETIGHARSGHPTLCPVARIVARLLHLRQHGATASSPLNAYFLGGRQHFVLPADITALLRRTARLAPPEWGFAPSDISARSLRAGGAMAMLCAGIDSDRIRLIGRWRSDEMYRYLHVQAQPVMSGVAAAMLRGFSTSASIFPPFLRPPPPLRRRSPHPSPSLWPAMDCFRPPAFRA